MSLDMNLNLMCHGIKKIVISKEIKKTYKARDIIATTADGEQLRVNLFYDDKIDIKFKNFKRENHESIR